MISSKMKKLIESRPMALATCNKDGQPNVVCVTSRRVVSKQQILITDNCFVKTRKNLLENPVVALAVCSEDEEEAYQFKGRVEYLISGKWKEAVDKDPDDQGWAHKAAVLVHVEEIYDLANPKLLYSKL
jgi:predicted pyridoxine 5'-phosphate oxidase superfamily flavin-nucleotide-binding protein